MIRRLFHLASVALCIVTAPSFASEMDWGPSSLRLTQDMTEQQAVDAVGYRPNKAELTTCGTEASSGPWTCRILTFGNRRKNLTVFQRDAGDDTIGRLWVVNHWVVTD